MSLVIFALVAGTAALGGYIAGRAARRRHVAAASRAEATDDAWGEGDVLSLPGGVDVVLAFEERFSRDGAVAARLFTPEIGPVIVLLPPPRARVLELVATTLDVATPPPTRLDVDGHILTRSSLLTIDEADAQTATRIADYFDGDAAAFVVDVSGEPARVFSGRWHRAADVDRLPGAKR